jgi:glycopeptide antibiotics resistance protein
MLLAMTAIIVGLSITPDHSRPYDSIFAWALFNTGGIVQKVLHLVFYAAFAALAAWTLEFLDSGRTRAALCIVLGFCLGTTLEWWQTFIPGRFGSMSDVIINLLGVLIGTAAALWWSRSRTPAG